MHPPTSFTIILLLLSVWNLVSFHSNCPPSWFLRDLTKPGWYTLRQESVIKYQFYQLLVWSRGMFSMSLSKDERWPFYIWTSSARHSECPTAGRASAAHGSSHNIPENWIHSVPAGQTSVGDNSAACWRNIRTTEVWGGKRSCVQTSTGIRFAPSLHNSWIQPNGWFSCMNDLFKMPEMELSLDFDEGISKPSFCFLRGDHCLLDYLDLKAATC